MVNIMNCALRLGRDIVNIMEGCGMA